MGLAMLIKIYCYDGDKPKEVATGLVDLSYPPRMTEYSAVTGYDVQMWMRLGSTLSYY